MVEKTFLESIATLLDRDLAKLEQEINQYPDDKSLWEIRGEIKNSAGTLALHLCGNLRHYIGHILGSTDYKRDRDSEFSVRDVPKETIIAQIKQTRQDVAATLNNLDKSALDREYPAHVFDYKMTTMFFLIHLQGHLNYHLGQVNYHRRLG
jgi:uncharacterized damage-inducible protein DinB